MLTNNHPLTEQSISYLIVFPTLSWSLILVVLLLRRLNCEQQQLLLWPLFLSKELCHLKQLHQIQLPLRTFCKYHLYKISLS
ncbi:hypothetical protein PRUPE_6G220100 [Prunus persica]|uniref:Uncharacterized protein n=1 Tax=Prunus persica TaxID=3760 RepID=A0A251NWI2_PRUPE|nr:hypothetical protein PRUPE_6G220100 [Prunus persica]